LVQQQIKDDLISKLAPRGVIVEDVLLRDVQLPPLLKASIEAKQQAEQDALRMSFILQRKNRKRTGRALRREALRISRRLWRKESAHNYWNGRASKRRRNWQRARTRRSW